MYELLSGSYDGGFRVFSGYEYGGGDVVLMSADKVCSEVLLWEVVL